MTAQFAGSRSLDDRRRRRLAQESEEVAVSSRGKSSRSAAKNVKTPPSAPEIQVSSNIASEESLVPRALWRVMLYGAVGASLWGVLIWLNLNLPLSGGLHQVFSPSTGNAFRFFSVVSLLISSQLCFTIWWYRSRSRKDFGGRYRIWGWAGCFWSLSCFSTGLGLHEPVARIAYQNWPIHTWKPELLYWFAPFSIGVLAIHQLVSQDMRHSKVSRILWNSSLACGCLVAGVLFGLDRVVSEGMRELLIASLVTFWHFMISFTLLYHARFVVHVTNEAAPRQTVWYFKLKEKLLQHMQVIQGALGNVIGFRLTKSEERKKTRLLKRQQRQELREAKKESRTQKLKAAKEEKFFAKEQALLKKEQARQEKKLAAEAAKQAARELKETKAKAKQKKPQSPEVEPTEKPQQVSEQQPEANTAATPRTSRGKKRKRVLGEGHRVDSAHASHPPHVTKATSEAYASDDFAEEEMEYQHMSKKERRRARKKKRG